MPNRDDRGPGIIAATAVLLLASAATAGAQPARSRGGPAPQASLTEPVEGRVYQRGPDGKADVPVDAGPDFRKAGFRVQGVTLTGAVERSERVRDGKIAGLPGGVYTATFSLEKDPDAAVPAAPVNASTLPIVVPPTLAPAPESASVSVTFFVGDLWILAGQSNMEGVGDLLDVAPPNDRVRLLGMDGAWSKAEEPLHWLVDSPDPVHSGDPTTREARASAARKARKKGAGLGLPFGSTMARATGVPVGLIACAHGGTSLEQWDPLKKDEAGKSLYGSMLRQVGLAGGKVKGMLWYQGESDALDDAGNAADGYGRAFADFLGSVRADLEQPDLPVYFVQIGRVIRSGDPRPWNTVQEAQRKLPDSVPNTAVVALIDLELDDGIHVGTQGLKRLGGRLARVALRELYGQVGATTPTFDRVSRGPGAALSVKFRGVNAPIPPASAAGSEANASASNWGLRPSRRIAGFSIRKADGSEIPLIYEAAVGAAKDTVVLKLVGKVPEGAQLWYGYGLDPYCNLVDGLDMAVPAFGPIPLDERK